MSGPEAIEWPDLDVDLEIERTWGQARCDEEDNKMIKLDEKKLAGLKTGSQHLAETYGEKGTPSREEFEAKAKAWYYAELLRDERKRQKLTQQQLGERIGKKREYISALEQGQTDMQLSTFMLIANALGLRFSLVPFSML